ncbi:hypothetical protein [Aliikangiella maris]|uniref:DUF1624 domain-containing protein n=1 Tax=Aliikangiella maris TaxID=3162458 RepID=A0ABV3MUI4_9GAMM
MILSPLQGTPTKNHERIDTLVVLRGFALLGIMFINIFVFAHPVNWFDVAWDKLNEDVYHSEL